MRGSEGAPFQVGLDEVGREGGGGGEEGRGVVQEDEVQDFLRCLPRGEGGVRLSRALKHHADPKKRVSSGWLGRRPECWVL